ncbi:hypothetical protein NQ317_016094 [Molorchus minor]|uniref:Uncharacterized protein n=1 Tax=Molorchus minor TaxID=1323400 RepID=A0ABQ9JHB1_9CUCU|nr:hypothetical protein NQ317_016094 [Molorchus minor]
MMAKERLASQKTQDDSFSGSTSSGTRKKTVQFINNIHSYSVSPGKIKKSLDESKQKVKDSGQEVIFG